MPAPGDQHSSNVANPFEEMRPRISEYTAQQVATLQSRLERQLGPEYISSRAGPSGQRVHYVSAEKCIALANDIFGFNGWSSSIQNVTMDFIDEHPETMRVSLGLSVVVRVTLRDGTYHEDIGYGHMENCRGKAAAFEKAKKEGTTDALKRALRNFGNVLGNCLYDKDYLGKVTKIKVPPTKFNEANLHRHPDYVKREIKEEKPEVKPEVKPPAPLKEEPRGVGDIELFSDDFADLDDVDFAIGEEGHPDEVVLGNTNNSSAPAPQNRPPAPAPVNNPPQTPNNTSRNVGPAPAPGPGPGPGPGPAMATRPQAPQQQQQQPPPHRRPESPGLSTPNTSGNRPPEPGAGERVGFFSARAINKEAPEASLADGLAPKAQQMFNPKAESPSIRRTPGIDHNSSKAIPRSALPPQGSQSGPTMGPAPGPRPQAGFQSGGRNVVNPHLEPMRRIGAPGGGVSPLTNRGQYRPPTFKRPLPGEGPGAVRPALAEMTNSGPVSAAQGANQNGNDVKRQKTT